MPQTRGDSPRVIRAALIPRGSPSQRWVTGHGLGMQTFQCPYVPPIHQANPNPRISLEQGARSSQDTGTCGPLLSEKLFQAKRKPSRKIDRALMAPVTLILSGRFYIWCQRSAVWFLAICFPCGRQIPLEKTKRSRQHARSIPEHEERLMRGEAMVL